MSLTKFGGHIENYHWGKTGSRSIISKYLNNPDESIPYAELWFGAHNRAPSPLIDQKGSLRDITQDLPYLLKILSIEKALSLQLHPDKLNASRLNDEDSTNYPDRNHKPEIAVALTETHCLYGFRPIAEIKKVLRKTPEYEIFIDKKILEEINEAREKNNARDFIRKIYESVLTANKSLYRKAAETLISRISSYTKLNRHERLVIQCVKDYGPEDLGVFSIPLMNYLVLQPEQALFTAPNTLHAYLSGDILECMANSDNVVRAGMTPKHQDIKTIKEIIEYKMAAPKIISPDISGNTPEIHLYKTPCNDFELSIFKGSGEKTITNSPPSPQILLCIDGQLEIVDENHTAQFTAGEACYISHSKEAFKVKINKANVARVRVA